MTFDEVLEQVRELLQSKGRVAYRALKRRFELDDEYLEDLKAELIDAEHVARDEDGKVLVWIGTSLVSDSTSQVPRSTSENEQPVSRPQPLDARPTDGERRQLTVEFIDLVGSTTLSQQLDPEDYHARVVAYQAACRQVIARYEGHIAQYLGDGVLVYFGYPAAHEEDAVRAVRSGLEIVAAVSALKFTPPLQVRIGVHTGPVMVGEIGAGERTERLALGETPNIAARVQGHAAPNEVLVSTTTFRLIHGLFETEGRGPQELKGISTPMTLYRVVRESTAQSRFEVAVGAGLTPLVGREEELGLLQRRWAQAKEGAGQVVLLSGEAGIGKSRLVQALKEQVLAEGATRIEFRCSPYHQNSAFYPIIDHLQRLLQFAQDEAPQAKLAKLQQVLAHYRFPQADTLPLLATLLSLPQPEGIPPLTLSPQKQKRKTQEALVAWIVEEAERAVVYCTWEDLHWADPSTRELLTLFLEQIPTSRVLAVLTFRPNFTPPWGSHSYFTQLTLSRLGRPHVEVMVAKVTGGKALPLEVLQQIVSKTDGVPLFVEELTKMVLESGLLREEDGRYVGAHDGAPLPPLAIPSTLQDSLMARLDRLGPAKDIAQLGATIGREFSYELLHAVSSIDEEGLQHGLKQLVQAELVYQRGLVPQVHYLFKHALIQDTAYQSLLKSRRQQYHRQIAKTLEEQFLQIVDFQPELVAHHYTEAGLSAQAIPYWQKAGQRATQHSANVEAIDHLTKGLGLLKALPDTPERAQQELTLQIALGGPLTTPKGWGAPEVRTLYIRAQALCQQLGETPQIFPALYGLAVFYFLRAELKAAHEQAQQLLRLAQNLQDPALLLEAHTMLGYISVFLGEFTQGRRHAEQGSALYDPQQHHGLADLYSGHDPGMMCLAYEAVALAKLGYLDQALQRSNEALRLTRELNHPFSEAHARLLSAGVHAARGELDRSKDQIEAAIALSSEQGFSYLLALGTIMQGYVLAAQGQTEEGIAEIHQGLVAYQATGARLELPIWLGALGAVSAMVGQAEEGLRLVIEALDIAGRTEERANEAELYRLRGELLLQRFKVQSSRFKVINSPASEVRSPESEAEECFLRALEISRKQQAKSLELRATVSLAQLWKQQSKTKEAHQMLSEIYNWFTEGFDTKDLQEAKRLIEELS
jgi:class 3 adenylate cyclase/predicted ATPase